ncbi:PUA-like superfamily [Babesia duncani]|uniref:PUA-like superfamily n=1 Tax=Babesia duncani TaxID=323732 RepID=A0AAD9PN78_9APIC|nr:PUA-like superfamily [Babesia duncani]
MMFECAVYREKFDFPSNIDMEPTSSTTNNAATQALLEGMHKQVEQKAIKQKIIKENVQKLKFPIVGEVRKPTGDYLVQLYHIVEENNRGLERDTLGDDAQPPGGRSRRCLIEPRNIGAIFPTSSVIKQVDLFATTMTSKSPLIPGQVSRVVLTPEHREHLVKSIRQTDIFGLFAAFVSKYDVDSNENPHPQVSPHATLCELLDITELDTCGVVIIRAVERFRFVRMLKIEDAVIKGEVSLLHDTRTPLRNALISQENAQALESLYDKCNFLEAEYRRKCGNMDDVEAIEARLGFAEKLEEMIRHIPLDVPDYDMRILELQSFCALEFHADYETKVWAANNTDTEERLVCARMVLEQKSQHLREKLKC